MNGPQHYFEAERCLAVAESTHWEGPTANVESAQTALAAAQVHATLALAAATAEQRDHTPQQDWGGTSTMLESQHEWDEAIK